MALQIARNPEQVEHLRAMAQRVAPVSLSGDQLLPVRSDLAPLVGSGLRRGSVVGVTGAGATTLLLALLAAATESGSWAAVVGLRGLSAEAAFEAGVNLDRLAVVPGPSVRWPTVVAAFVDAVDLVAFAPSPGVTVRVADARRLVTRARERGAVLIVRGAAEGGTPGVWPAAPDLVLTATASRWEGGDNGHGHLQRRVVDVASGGRGAASRRRCGSVEVA